MADNENRKHVWPRVIIISVVQILLFWHLGDSDEPWAGVALIALRLTLAAYRSEIESAAKAREEVTP
jgi:hypothetical protein